MSDKSQMEVVFGTFEGTKDFPPGVWTWLMDVEYSNACKLRVPKEESYQDHRPLYV
jgi:hypothetical protein